MEDLTIDDYDLTLKQLKSQRVSVMLQLAALDGSIAYFVNILELMDRDVKERDVERDNEES